MRKTFLRELRILFGDRYRMLILFFVPLFYMAFYGTVFFTSGVEHIDIGVLDNDNGSLSRRLTIMLDGNPVLEVHNYTDYPAMRADIERRRIIAGVVIPEGWEVALKSKHQARVQAFISTSNFLLANEANKYLQTVFETMNAGVSMNALKAAGIPEDAALRRIQPVVAPLISEGNPSYGYGQFVTFAILLLILHQILMISMAQSVASEREFGTLNEWWNTAGGTWRMLVGKGSLYFGMFVLYLIIELVVTMKLVHIQQRANVAMALLYALPGLITLTAMGLFFGSFLESRAQALQVVGISSVPLLLISGFLWPFAYLPWLYRIIALFLPTYPFMIGLQGLTQLGSTFTEQLPTFLLCCGQAVFWWGLAWWRTRSVGRV